MSAEPKITILRKDCPDDETCAAFTEVSSEPDYLYAIVEMVSDPAILAAHRHAMAPHEVLVRFPRTLAPELAVQ